MAFFSIIIPVYNVEDWLPRCLESILKDSCKDMELILVNDGSTDHSPEICDQYAAMHTNIQVIHKENGGLSSARNAGLNVASGEWISFIDSDDWVEQDCFSKIQSLLMSQPDNVPDIVKFGYKKTGISEEQIMIPCIAEGKYKRDEIIRTLLPLAFGNRKISDSTIHTFILSACTHVYRHDFLRQEKVRFISERLVGSEDFLFIYSLYMRASSVLVSHLIWYNYDTREGSLTQTYKPDLYTRYRLLGKAIYNELKRNQLYSLLSADYKILYISLIYVCVMNEGASTEQRAVQVAHVKDLLKDNYLQKCLRNSRFPNTKSQMIAACMRFKASLPLCIIQWRKAKAGRRYEYISK